MCGIAGALSRSPVAESIITAMRDTLVHRGPDAAGVWRSPDARVALGHQRLAIIDLDARSNQPMISHDGRLVITFNGEIYNYKAIRRQLEGEGLVTVYPHRGAVVSELSGEELQEMCEIRIALETAAVRLAIPHLDEETLSRGEAILTATDRETDVVAHWSKNNWTFHSTLYMPAHRPRLLAMIKTLHDNIERYLRLHVSILNYKEQGQLEHWQILDACRRHDTAAAVTLLERHIEGVAELLAAYLNHERTEEPDAGTFGQ